MKLESVIKFISTTHIMNVHETMMATTNNSPTATEHQYPVYWVSVSVDHLKSDVDPDNADGCRRWWPCLAYTDFSSFLQAHGVHHDDDIPALFPHVCDRWISSRIVENMLEGKKVSIAKLFGRPLQDFVEIVHPIKLHRDNAQQQQQEQEHTLESLDARQTLWHQQFNTLDQEEIFAQLDPEFWNDEDLYKSFMGAMDQVRQDLNSTSNTHAFAELAQRKWQHFRGVDEQLQAQAAGHEEVAATSEETGEGASEEETAPPADAAVEEETAMEEEDVQNEPESHPRDRNGSSITDSCVETVVTQDSSDEEEKDPGILPRDSFQQTIHKLQLSLGWDVIQYQGKTVWIQPGKDPSSNDSLVLGKDYFGETELKEYLQTKYGWKRPQIDTTAAAQSPSTAAAPDTNTADKHKTPQTNSGKKSRGKKPRAFVTPSPKVTKDRSTNLAPPRSSTRKRAPRGALEDEDMLQRSKKQSKIFHFKSDAEADFYNFGPLMNRLKKHGWKYRGGNLGGWTYIIPRHNGPKQGGQEKVDYFTEEEDVVEYCMNNQYFERRQELGLAD
jgi:hypothetical protein